MGGSPSTAMGATCHCEEDAFGCGCVSGQLSFLIPCNLGTLSVLQLSQQTFISSVASG